MTHTKAIQTIDLADGIVAILAGNQERAQWEVYYVVDGLEMFSHVATGKEARQFATLAYGGELIAFAAQRMSDAKHFGLTTAGA